MISVKPLVSAIVVNWNGKEVIEDCLDSLLNQSWENIEIIVVDNGSEDESLSFIKANYGERVVIVCNNENEGFSRGCNIGIAKSKGEFIALLNNDAVADSKWIEELLSSFGGEPETGMAASKILVYGQNNIIDNVGHLLYRDGINRGKGRGELDSGQYDNEKECLFPSGCALMYRRAMLDEIGLFDEDFFAYGDDTDLGLRGRLCGWEAVFNSQAIVYHRYSFSTGAYSSEKFFLVERNRIFILLKYFPLPMIAISHFHTMYRYFYHFIAAIQGKGATGGFEGSLWDLIVIMLRAHIDALKLIPSMVKKRRFYIDNLKMKPAKLGALLRKYSISAKEIAFRK